MTKWIVEPEGGDALMGDDESLCIWLRANQANEEIK